MFTCEICLFFIGNVPGKEVKFDFEKKWNINLKAVTGAVLGSSTVRYLTPATERSALYIVRFLLLQTFELVAQRLPAYTFSLSVAGHVIDENSSDGKLTAGDTMGIELSNKVEFEDATIVTDDFD